MTVAKSFDYETVAVAIALLILAGCAAPLRKTQPIEIDASYGAGKLP